MTDTPAREHPAAYHETAAEAAAHAAEKTVEIGHNGYGIDERQGYAAVAQVHATLAVSAEIRALSLRVEDALITMLDREPAEPHTLDPVERMLLRGPAETRTDPAAVAAIGLVVFLALATAAAGAVIGLGYAVWSAPFLVLAAAAFGILAARAWRQP
jgi:hypothetical protein